MYSLRSLSRLFAAIVVSITLLFSVAAYAQSAGPVDHLTNIGGEMGLNPSPEAASESLAMAMGTVIKTIISITGSIMMAYIIFAGWLWMTAHGQEDKISKAKNIIRGSVIGLIIVFSAYIITATVVDRFSRSAGYNVQSSGEGAINPAP